MKNPTLLIIPVCFSVPAVLLWMVHLLDVQYLMPLRQSGEGQVWFVLVFGEFLYLISRFIRKQ